ncbi:MFS transporter [Burkholderia cepacia]|uniref:MFS transporter n=1 Tax=Burkholderia cepacia TaxID=292 RepID=A0A8I1AJA5_BURCE|nr:MFS transporter [Burkholderia cepacia]MBA9896466.1 MFS transporter [Burkholderia cepacia]MBA9945558.1 MFS transporter [Burkholderia cepacia]MBA9973044.1 MFS transporter [Burkholderia cepacia]MBA9991617.1 MFS transporter [Burkholderia cepacia]MBB0000520.1 MFS transporter [Burkholderia cepacia]
MMPSTRWQLIVTYVCADAAVTVSSRILQFYATWLLLKGLANPSALTLMLVATWATTLLILPFTGIVADRVRKSTVLLGASLLALASVIPVVVVALALHGTNTNWLIVVIVVASVTSSVAVAALMPLSTPLIPEISPDADEVRRGLRLKASGFILNILFGPTLAGFMIGAFGGESALWVSVASSCLGVVAALAFHMSFSAGQLVHARSGEAPSFFQDLRRGMQRVLGIRAERAIATASLLANMLFVPFVFFLLPAKVLAEGGSMLNVAGIELSLGAGVLAASALLIQQARRIVSDHAISIVGIAMIGASIFAFGCSHMLAVWCMLGFALGTGLTMFNVTVNSKRAMAIPAGHRAGMESSLMFLCTAAAPLGIWMSGAALKALSPNAVIIYGSELFVLALLCIAFSRPLRLMLNSDDGGLPHYLQTNRELFDLQSPS